MEITCSRTVSIYRFNYLIKICHHRKRNRILGYANKVPSAFRKCLQMSAAWHDEGKRSRFSDDEEAAKILGWTDESCRGLYDQF
jgi:hypothetical protein